MRLDFDTFREVADSLTRNRARSILTGFGIFWGIFMLLFLKGGGAGFKDKIMQNFEGFASNAIFITSGETTMPYKGFREGRSWSLDYTDAVRFGTGMPEVETVSPLIFGVWSTAERGSNSADLSVVKGVTPAHSAIEEPFIRMGRYINETDLEQERKVCVIGKDVYANLFPEGGDPCGQQIRAGGFYFTIVGYDEGISNISLGGSSSYSLIIPFTVARKLLNRGESIDVIGMTLRADADAKAMEPRIREMVGPRHFVDPEDKPAIIILNTAQMFGIMDNLFRGVNFLIWLIGLGTIFAGVIGVSNIMMVSVKSRTVEIGIRRAIGATPGNILLQIILESITLMMIAGCLGIMFSVFVLDVIEKAGSSGAFQLDFWTAVTAVLMLTVLGVIAGLAPASRAMGIKPVDAMRDE